MNFTKCENCKKKISLDAQTFYPYGDMDEDNNYINPERADEPYCEKCSNETIAMLKN